MTKPHIAVVGAGIIGICSAYFLNKSGFKVTLIDKNEPEQYAIEKNGVYYLYANLRGINENTGNFLELLEIVDKKHEDVSTKQLLIEEEND